MKEIQWYPGHMAKTRRQLVESLSAVDVVCELLDARIPVSSRNPDIGELTSGKPRVVILNRIDQAEPSETRRWAEALRSEGNIVLETDAKSGRGIDGFGPAVRQAAKELIARREAQGRNVSIRVMIVGVPNVGKSSLINRIAGGKKAKAEDRPGVTRSRQWFFLDGGLELLDTPGMLWPKFDDPKTGLHLAFTGAVKDEIMDIEGLAASLAALLSEAAPEALTARYGIDLEAARAAAYDLPGEPGGPPVSTLGAELLEAIGRRRGCMERGGEVDLHRAATLLLDEYRGGKIGRITLEKYGRE